MEKKHTKPKTIDSILKDVIKKLSGKNRITAEEMARVWEQAAGERAAAHTKPVSIKKSVLTINVDDSGWLYELTIKKKDLLKKMEGKTGSKQLKGLRFRIGEIR